MGGNNNNIYIYIFFFTNKLMKIFLHVYQTIDIHDQFDNF